MIISYSLSEKQSVELPVENVNIHELFEESTSNLWSKFGNGQLYIFDNQNVSLAIEKVGSNNYFLDWHKDGRLVAYNGENCDEYFITDYGGDNFYIPKACTVDKQTAMKAVLFAIKEKNRYPKIDWLLMDNVPFNKGWYDS